MGDRLSTRHAGMAPIRWVWRRNTAPVYPVRIVKSAFADERPKRDLWLSPDSAVLFDEVLIPVRHLINGYSIARRVREAVEYWHVQLERHDVLLAENLPVESFRDTGARAAFARTAGQAAPPEAGLCAPLAQQGPHAIQVKQSLFRRAGLGGTPRLGIRVLADRRILPAHGIADGVRRYALPRGVRQIRLVSPPWMPAAWHAASLDQRRLGVRLLGVWLDGVAIALDDPAFSSGFHPPENSNEGRCRWTDGDARLSLPDGVGEVALQVGDGAGAYRGGAR